VYCVAAQDSPQQSALAGRFEDDNSARSGAAVNEPVAVVALSFVTVLIAIWIAVQVIGGS
jgi:hypothetical protein